MSEWLKQLFLFQRRRNPSSHIVLMLSVTLATGDSISSSYLEHTKHGTDIHTLEIIYIFVVI